MAETLPFSSSGRVTGTKRRRLISPHRRPASPSFEYLTHRFRTPLRVPLAHHAWADAGWADPPVWQPTPLLLLLSSSLLITLWRVFRTGRQTRAHGSEPMAMCTVAVAPYDIDELDMLD